MRAFFILVFLVSIASQSQASLRCDCTKIIGQCEASIKLKSVSGAKPSYSAEYAIQSTAPTCSKVSYYIDNTPHFNILTDTHWVEDSSFGTSPATPDTFSVIKCEVCQQSRQAQPSTEPLDQGIAPTNPFVGKWSGTLKWAMVKDPIAIHIEQGQDGGLSGYVTGKSGSSSFTSVTTNGNTLTYTFTGKDGGSYAYQLLITGKGQANVKSLGLLNFSGTVRKD